MTQAQLPPLFAQIAETLKARINNFEYKPGDPVPSAKELEDEFGVSNITVRRAMDMLAKDGYVIPRRGLRAQVADLGKEIVEIEITGDFRTWFETATGKKFKVRGEVIDREVIDCPDPIRGILALEPGAKVERIKRVRKLRGRAISYFINYGPLELLKQIPSKDIEERSFIEAYQAVPDVKLEYMKQRVQVTTADMDLAGILHVEFGFPLFFVQNVYFLENHAPMAVTYMYFRGDHYAYTVRRSLRDFVP